MKLGVLCGVEEVKTGFLVDGDSKCLLECLTCCFGKPYIGVGGLDKRKGRSGKEGGLCGSTVSDGLNSDYDITVDVLIQGEGSRVRNESRGIISAEDELSILACF